MWRILAAALITTVGMAGMAQAQTETPTPPSIIVTVILVPATATDTPTPTETPAPTEGPSPTPTLTPTSTPASGLVIEHEMGGEDGVRTAGTLTYTISAGEFMIAVLLFALLATQVITWVLKLRGR